MAPVRRASSLSRFAYTLGRCSGWLLLFFLFCVFSVVPGLGLSPSPGGRGGRLFCKDPCSRRQRAGPSCAASQIQHGMSLALSPICSWRHQGMGRSVRSFTITSVENTHPSTETLGVEGTPEMGLGQFYHFIGAGTRG